MKPIYKIITLSVLSLSLSQMSQAAGDGFYFGAAAGQSNIHQLPRAVVVDSTGRTVMVEPTNTGFAGRLFTGYNFTPYGGMEMGFTSFAAAKYETPTSNCGTPSVRMNAIDLVGKGILPMAAFNLYGKAGMAVVRENLSGSLAVEDTAVSTCRKSNTSMNVRPTFGVGAAYDFNANWEVDVSWNRILKGGNIQNLDIYALALSYHFADKFCGQFLC